MPTPSQVSTSDNLNFTITNGSRAGNNLFHSFSEFSIPTGGSAVFDNVDSIQNIISRVTGGSISRIDGLITTNGRANLFLLNPNGIILSPNASLDIGGSFIASTANRLNFADGKFFSATDSQSPPLLTVSVPVGLQFDNSNGSIQVKGENFCPCLLMQPNTTLALVGNGVFLDNGYFEAPEGRIELGSVTSPALVSLTPVTEGWELGYEGIQKFGNISLANFATLDTSGEFGGAIQLYGRRITIDSESNLLADTLGRQSGKTLKINASESLKLSAYSFFSTAAFSNGRGGDIDIQTPKLIVQNSEIRTSTEGIGDAGSITIDAPNSVEVSGKQSAIATKSFSLQENAGDAGDIEITTDKLIVSDRGRINANTDGPGNAGNISIKSDTFVHLTDLDSGLFSETNGTGRGGNINIFTPFFNITNGATVDVRTTADGEGGNIFVKANSFEAGNGSQLLTTTLGDGDAGDITLKVRDTLTLTGSNSGLFANTTPESTGDAGSIFIDPQTMTIQDGASISVDTQGTGEGGNIDLQAGNLRLDRGIISAKSTIGTGGNIKLTIEDLLLLQNNSQISATASNDGNGGNITIDTDLLVALENSDITANAFRGRGGNIQITARGLFLSPDSEITASSELGIDGVVDINTPESDPTDKLSELPETIEPPQEVAQGCRPGQALGNSRFVNVGRGGLPPGPNEPNTAVAVWQDLRPYHLRNSDSSASAVDTNTSSTQAPTQRTKLFEAKSWTKDSQGRIILTANIPQAPTHGDLQPTATC
ncbi:MAG: filamentous hemagglutinin N-terminal domain-containing protein [Acaryochloris sp. RU_4_1]|nr:filamentous hemagglutinin N-terminal domain-containing protein [Acaryochloris sp. RU_4_1]NJR56150.1 filamentous hemagglutinin N-terminal domain-containing protein [Acaryochloris sp. CRU_2_0]